MKVKRFENLDYDKIDFIIDFIERYFDMFVPDISFDEHNDLRLCVYFFNGILNNDTLYLFMRFLESLKNVKNIKWFFNFNNERLEILLDSNDKIESLLKEFEILKNTKKYNL